MNEAKKYLASLLENNNGESLMSFIRNFFAKHLNLEILALGAGLNAYLGIIGLVPFTIGVLVEGYGFDLKTAGLYASIEIVVMSIAAMAVAPVMNKIRNSRLAITGGLIIALGNVIVAMYATSTLVVLGLMIAGVGYGFVAAAVNASVASSDEPEKVYASGILVYAIAGSVLFAVLPMLYLDSFPVYFWAQAVISVAAILLYARLDDSKPSQQKTDDVSASVKKSALLSPRAIALFLATFLVWTGMGLIWAVTERMGVSIGMSSQEAAYALVLSNVIGMVGGLLVKFFGESYGRAKPLFIGALVMGLSFIGISNADLVSVFTFALIVYGIAYFFLLPYIMGAAVALDSEGKVAAFNGAMPSVSAAISPALGAYLAATYSFSFAGNTAFVFAVVGGLLTLPCALYLDSRHKKAKLEALDNEQAALNT